MSRPNRLAAIVGRINGFPAALRPAALTFFFRRAIRFTGTAGCDVLELSERRSVVVLRNRRRVQNHIGSVHAVATILIAESATGYLVGMNVPDTSVPVIKSIRADYVKRAAGDMRAVAELTEAQVHAMRTEEKGETAVKVTITDGAGNEPVVAELVWAWTPKRR